MILWNERQWRREMLLCALVFQVIFLVELVGLLGDDRGGPGVHRISYENWGWLINDWQAPPIGRTTSSASSAWLWP